MDEQRSDSLDKLHMVWNDIFLDTNDLHSKFNRENYYGPVLFKFSTKFLLSTKYQIRITKANPEDWRMDDKKSDKYFRNVKEIEATWNEYQHQKRMITLKDNRRPALFNYLDEIVLDDLNESVTHNDLALLAMSSLRKAKKNKVSVKIFSRKCDGCFCTDNYPLYSNFKLRKKFSPTGF